MAEPTPVAEQPDSLDGLLPVQTGIRILCFLLDLSVLTIAASITAVVSLVTGLPEISTMIAPLVVAAVGVWNLSWLILTGKTFGKAALGVRAVGVSSSSTPTVRSAALRVALFGVTGGLVSLSVLADRTPWRRGWHDVASGIVLIDALNGRNPLGPAVVVSVLRKPDRGLRAVQAPIALSDPTAAPALLHAAQTANPVAPVQPLVAAAVESPASVEPDAPVAPVVLAEPADVTEPTPTPESPVLAEPADVADPSPGPESTALAKPVDVTKPTPTPESPVEPENAVAQPVVAVGSAGASDLSTQH